MSNISEISSIFSNIYQIIWQIVLSQERKRKGHGQLWNSALHDIGLKNEALEALIRPKSETWKMTWMTLKNIFKKLYFPSLQPVNLLVRIFVFPQFSILSIKFWICNDIKNSIYLSLRLIKHKWTPCSVRVSIW